MMTRIAVVMVVLTAAGMTTPAAAELCAGCNMSAHPQTVSCAYCYVGVTLPIRYYEVYSTGSVDLTHFDATSNTWNDNRGMSLPKQYTFDASETLSERNACIICQHHRDWFFDRPENNRFAPPIGGGARSPNWAPLYGPCLSGAPSIAAQCVQNVALFPPTFVGRYFYPMQKPLPVYEPLFGAGTFPVHLFLVPTDAQSNVQGALGCNAQSPPTFFQLGSDAIRLDLDTYKIINRTTGVVDVNATANLTGPYRQDGFVKWTQHWCAAGCHRNARYYTVEVQESDYKGIPRHSYLSRFTEPDANNQLLVCKECPAGHAAYYWNEAKNPEEPVPLELNVAAQMCYPWFGVLPQMVLDVDMSQFSTSTLQHGPPLDRVLTPAAETVVGSEPCPVNTYNRECAHAKRYYYQMWEMYLAGGEPATAAIYWQQFQCTPCPPGWHTNGTTGAWFCLPPPGQVLENGIPPHATLFPRGVMPVWANRDLIQAEMECGYKPEHCLQCAAFGMPAGTLPREFNEKVVWSSVLANKSCDARYYCPDAFTRIQCPAERPYSPPGSWLLQHCGCDAGRFLNGAGVCVPCTNASSCGVGYYLPPTCLNNPSQTQDTPCAPCTNVPANATLIACTPAQRPCSTYLNGPEKGVCSFQCNFGFVLKMDNSDCAANMQCKPVGVIRSPGPEFAPMYKPELLNGSTLDRFMASGCPIGQQFSLDFSNMLSSSLTQTSDGYSGTKVTTHYQWWPTKMLCAAGACGANVSMCYNKRVPWYSLTSDVQCVPCPHPDPPTGGVSNSIGDVTKYIATCSDVRCQMAGTFFNESAWACQSCAERAARVCPPSASGTLMQLMGQGCMGVARPFNLTSPAADCVPCNLNVADAPPGHYLKLDPSAACAFAPCSTSSAPGSQYMSTLCGGTTDAVWTDCDVGNREQGPCAGRPNHYVSQPCTNLSNQICRECTSVKLGYFITLPCSNATQDTQWDECKEGYYCDASGTKKACPAGKTSRKRAESAADCYCMPGTRLNADGLCERLLCTGVAMPGRLGDANRSALYVFTDMGTTPPGVDCVPCAPSGADPSTAAFSRGDGVSFESCVCPFGYAGTASGEGRNQRLTCAPCPSTAAACGAQQSHGPVCWKGDMRGPQSCVCAAPPFGELRAGECASQCVSPFNKSSVGSFSYAASGSTGSALYVTRERSQAGWTRFVSPSTAAGGGMTSRDIVSFAVTSDYADTDYNNVIREPQYVVWCVDSLNVHVTQVPMLNAEGVTVDMVYESRQTYYSTNVWNALYSNSRTENNAQVNVVGVAVSQWRRIATADTKARVPQVVVAAVILETFPYDSIATPRLLLRTNSLDLTVPLAQWGTSISGATAERQLLAQKGVQMVGIAHSNVIPPSVVDQGEVFYVAYNVDEGCGGIVRIAPLNTAGGAGAEGINGVCLQNTTRRITAFAVRTPAPGAFTIYIAFGASVYALQMPSTNSPVRLITETTPVYGGGSSNVFAGGLLQLFTTYPLLVARDNQSGALYAGDKLQRSFVPVEGLPWGTKASPAGLAGVATSYHSGVLVAAFGNGLYSIDVSMCPPTSTGMPQYWDGGDHFAAEGVGQTCVVHQCLRPAFCKANEVAQQGYSCRCVDGFVRPSPEADCQKCLAGTTYCKNQEIVNCLYDTRTSKDGASSENDCTCSGSNGMYLNTVGVDHPTCTACPRGTWCPNYWQSFTCPGNVDITSSPTTGSITTSPTSSTYPTTCVCAAGSVGANCEPCPLGYYCPALQNQVVNTGSTLLVVASPLVTQKAVVDAVLSALLSFFAPLPNIPPYLLSSQTLRSRVFVQYIPATNRTQSMVAVMVQVDKVGEIEPSISKIKGWPEGLKANLGSGQALAADAGFYVTGFWSGSSDPVPNAVRNNTATLCPSGRVPSPMRESCVCAPGYATSTTVVCAPCAAGTFKDFAGMGACSKCPAGFTSKAGAANCTATGGPSSPSAPSAADGGQDPLGGSMVYIVAGAVGGLLLIFGLIACFVRRRDSSG